MIFRENSRRIIFVHNSSNFPVCRLTNDPDLAAFSVFFYGSFENYPFHWARKFRETIFLDHEGVIKIQKFQSFSARWTKTIKLGVRQHKRHLDVINI